MCYCLTSRQWKQDEDIELQKLLNKWQKIDQADALYLLSR